MGELHYSEDAVEEVRRVRGERKRRREQEARYARFTRMADDAAALIEGAICEMRERPDVKNLKAVTGALKDLRDLIEAMPGAEESGGFFIRIENDIGTDDDGINRKRGER